MQEETDHWLSECSSLLLKKKKKLGKSLALSSGVWTRNHGALIALESHPAPTRGSRLRVFLEMVGGAGWSSVLGDSLQISQSQNCLYFSTSCHFCYDKPICGWGYLGCHFWPLRLKTSWPLKRHPEGVFHPLEGTGTAVDACVESRGEGASPPACVSVSGHLMGWVWGRTWTTEFTCSFTHSWNEPLLKPSLRSTDPLMWGEGC